MRRGRSSACNSENEGVGYFQRVVYRPKEFCSGAFTGVLRVVRFNLLFSVAVFEIYLGSSRLPSSGLWPAVVGLFLTCPWRIFGQIALASAWEFFNSLSVIDLHQIYFG